tara:strand:- start:331 stop:726 length:396 start_codon:yes stop_codon:yes gene_type:complete
MFVTMMIGVYDSKKKEILLSNAGHEPPLILSDDGKFTNFTDSGPPLGIQKKIIYQENVLPFSSSSMYIFTDGITEIKDTSDHMLGADGFKSFIKKHQKIANNQRLKTIIDDIISSGKIQKDDLTILVVDGK